MLTALYCRVSKRTGQDITTQILYLKEYAKRKRLKIYKIYCDVGRSGVKESRPYLDLMLDDMRAKKFKAILVYKFSDSGDADRE